MTSSSDVQPRYRALVLHQPVARAWLLPFVIAGILCIVGGGLLAAATAYVTTQKTAWATAYVVLVGGVAQVGLGSAVTWLNPQADRRAGWWAFIGWNIGNAGVLAGQLADLIVLTYLGSAALIGALVFVLVASIQTRTPAGVQSIPAPHYPGILWGFRILLIILVLGIGVGNGLAQIST